MYSTAAATGGYRHRTDHGVPRGCTSPEGYRRGTAHPWVPLHPCTTHGSTVWPLSVLRENVHFSAIMDISACSVTWPIGELWTILAQTSRWPCRIMRDYGCTDRKVVDIGVLWTLLTRDGNEVLQSLEPKMSKQRICSFTLFYTVSSVKSTPLRQVHARSNELQLRNVTVWVQLAIVTDRCKTAYFTHRPNYPESVILKHGQTVTFRSNPSRRLLREVGKTAARTGQSVLEMHSKHHLTGLSRF